MSGLKDKPGGRLRHEDYYLDPGDVNVHQFYPVLDLTFGKQVAILREESFQATDEMSSDSDHTMKNIKETTVQSHEPENEKEKAEAGSEVITDKRSCCESGQSGLLDGCSAGSDVIIENGLFSTAVNEESIEAAKERGQRMFLTNDWRSGGSLMLRGFAKIVVQKAYDYFQMAMQMKNDENFVGAIACLTKAINFRSDDPILFVERGEAYLSLGDFQSAILNYKKACLLSTSSAIFKTRLVFIFHLQGQVLFDLGLYTDALESFSRASEMFPDNLCYQMRCISCLAALQRYGECLAMVNKSLNEHKTNPDLYIVRARLNEFFANTSSCYQDVQEALKLQPDHSEGQTMMEAFIKRANSHKLLALQLCIKGRDREALQKISLAIQTYPVEANFHVLRGALHRKLRDFNAAVDDFLLALDKCGHKEEDPVFHHAQRQLLLTFNDFAVDCFHKCCFMEAITLLNKALNEEKREKFLYVNRGDCFFRENELTFALQDYEQAQELDPQDPSIKFRISLVHNELGVRLFQDKNYSDAEKKFSLAIDTCPLIGHYYISRCRTHYLSENLSEAREDFLRGLLLSPTSEGITSISSRLFPGKSLADIVHSPAGRDTQMKLASLFPANVSAHSPGNYQSTADAADRQESCQSTNLREPFMGSTDFVLCMKEREFYVRQAREKKKVSHGVKDALFNNRSLRYNGPQILPLPLASQERNKVLQGQDLEHFLATSTGKDKPEESGTNWRNFSLSITRN